MDVLEHGQNDTSEPVQHAPNRRLWPGHVALIVTALLGALVIAAGLVVFMAGDVLFGSDSNSIDSYNREVLESCEVPNDFTLVETAVISGVDESGRFRGMSFLYASSRSTADLTADSFDQACRFGQRPSVRVLSPSDLSDAFSTADRLEVQPIADVPPGTQSYLQLRLAQREREGFFS